MSGFVGDLSSEQAEALTKFKAAVADLPNKPDDTDSYLLKWLRARRFNVDKALLMFKDHLVFREEAGVETSLKDWVPPRALTECYPGGVFGEDRTGHPVWYYNIGNTDTKGLFRASTHEDRQKYLEQTMEVILKIIREATVKKGPAVDSITCILDMEKLSFQKHYYWPAIQSNRESQRIMEANYPEVLHHIIILKTPRVFPVFYNLTKHFMDKRTKEKIIMLSANWKEELQQYISPDQLPKAYGGTRCEPDEWCTDHINPGCDVPPEYYLTNLTETGREEMERVVVGRGSSCDLQYQVETQGSLIRWEFVSVDYDISYGLFYAESAASSRPKLIPVVPVKKVHSHMLPEAGSFTCENTGQYVFKFDNSYSWTRSKEVYYSLKILPPHSQPELPDTGYTMYGEELAVNHDDSDDDFYECENPS